MFPIPSALLLPSTPPTFYQVKPHESSLGIRAAVLDHLAGPKRNLRFTSLRTCPPERMITADPQCKHREVRVFSLSSTTASLRHWVIAGLGFALYGRYLISSQEDDLLAAIPLLTESLLFPFSPEVAPVSLTIKIFYLLACSLASRFELRRDLRDLEQAVTYYRHILTLPPGALDSFKSWKAHESAGRQGSDGRKGRFGLG
ncbi:hypothetical protein BC827DRAFT_1229915 [Russula dissimulans]|nr:hypothetical protein BC827DRAFT_1229915 [Russula dissimulans]